MSFSRTKSTGRSSYAERTNTGEKVTRSDLFRKYLVAQWTVPLRSKADRSELCGVIGHIPKNSRQLLKIDMYEAQLLCKMAKISTIKDLYVWYVKDRMAAEKLVAKCLSKKKKEFLSVVYKIEHALLDRTIKKQLLGHKGPTRRARARCGHTSPASLQFWAVAPPLPPPLPPPPLPHAPLPPRAPPPPPSALALIHRGLHFDLSLCFLTDELRRPSASPAQEARRRVPRVADARGPA